MTEAEWLAAADPEPMLTLVRNEVSDRKLRLFTCACIRSMAPKFSLEIEPWLAVAERFADGEVDHLELVAARARRAPLISPAILARWCCAEPADAWIESLRAMGEAAQKTAAGILREVRANPFRLLRFSARWRTVDSFGLARGIYEDRAFDRMPLLADALMDAGCDDDQIISHCRAGGPHVRGCWVVDLVLGKE